MARRKQIIYLPIYIALTPCTIVAQYLIKCVIKDQNDVIIQVDIMGGLRFDVQAVAEYIREGKHEFYTTTPDGQHTVQVHAIRRDGISYITTSPDGRLPNNLDFLPVCT
jgi:hypothetical protein